MGATITVSGGAGGIIAELDDLRRLARLYGDAASDCGGTSRALHGYLFDVGNLVSATLDPAGAAEFEFAVEAAVDGPGGATWIAARCALLDLDLRAAATGYEVFLDLDRVARPTVQAGLRLPEALEAGWRSFWRSGNPLTSLDAALAADPEFADEIILNLVVAVASRAPGPDLQSVLAAAERADDGNPRVQHAGADPAGDAAGPPRSITDLIQGLARRSDGRDGEIDVRKVVEPDGRAGYIVDIPGTKSWDPLPTGDITSLVTNLRAVTGQQTSYERGVLDAMKAAGVRPSDPVMMIGHSEGGMVAVNAAIHCAKDGRFTITNVVTAGAPIGLTSANVPRSVQVLAIENAGDVVPHLDGVNNEPSPNISTVTVHHQHGEVLDNHDLRRSYVPGAQDIDASTDPSIEAFRRSADPFLGATAVSTQTYVVTRGY